MSPMHLEGSPGKPDASGGVPRGSSRAADHGSSMQQSTRIGQRPSAQMRASWLLLGGLCRDSPVTA